MLDEIIDSKFQDLDGFIVKSIDVNKFADIRLEFTNGFTLEAFTDFAREDDEAWRFWHRGDEEHLVITGKGIEPPEEEEEEEEEEE
jgi:hypothetical protein